MSKMKNIIGSLKNILKSKKIIVPLFIIFFFLTIFFLGKDLLKNIKEKFFTQKPPPAETVQPQVTSLPEPSPETKVKTQIEEWEERIKNRPSDFQTYYSLGMAYYHEGKVGLALLMFDKVMEIAPYSKEAEDAKTWINQESERAISFWRDNIARKHREAIQIGEYVNIKDEIKAIAKRVETEEKKMVEAGKEVEEKPTSLTPSSTAGTTTPTTPPTYLLVPVTPVTPVAQPSPAAPGGRQ